MLTARFLEVFSVLCLLYAGTRCDEGSGEEKDLEEDTDHIPDYEHETDFLDLYLGRSCRSKIYEELKEVKSAIRELETSLQGLREKLHPDFKVPPTEKPSAKRKCPRGFHYLPKINSCYSVVYEEHNWTAADHRCREMHRDAHLAAITTSHENNIMRQYLRSELQRNSHKNVCVFHDWGDSEKKLWTSGHRRNDSTCSEPFVWQLSPEKQLPLDFTDWATYEPNCAGENEHCMHIRPRLDYKWNDISCAKKICPMCEFDPK